MAHLDCQKMTGGLSFEEKMLVNYICETGLKETRALLKKSEHDTGKAQTEGAILAFETIQDANFTTIEEFYNQYRLLAGKCDEIRQEINTKSQVRLLEYWKLRGQQLQIEFILDRILAYRVMTQQTKSSISARAGIYVSEWLMNKQRCRD